jgi:hypothetical protein
MESLYPLKVQRKLSNGIAALPLGRSLSDRKRSRPSCFSATPQMAEVRAERLLKIRTQPSPELRIPGAAA